MENLELKSALDAIRAGIAAHGEQAASAHRRLDELEVKMSTPGFGKSTANQNRGAKGLVDAIMGNLDTLRKSGRLILEVPSTLSTKAFIASTGVVNPELQSGIEPGERYAPSLRSLFRSVPISSNAAFAVRASTETPAASPQTAEGDSLNEATYAFAASTIPVATIGHYTHVAKQAMDDVDGLSAFLDEALLFGLERKVEEQVLYGDGTTGNLTGIDTTAEAFDSTILSAADGWNRLDMIAAAATQLRESGLTPSFFVVHPRDWFRLVISKDGNDRYLMGDPRSTTEEVLWSMRAVVTNQITTTKFLVGDASKAIVRQRQTATLDISDSHGDNFIKNLLTVRAEERLALVKLRTDAFVSGTFSTSPA